MSDEKFDIPEELSSATLPTLLTAESKIRFRCYKGISCFNDCCRKADITLAPYDVLRPAAAPGYEFRGVPEGPHGTVPDGA